MKAQSIPAQITTVEDKIAGNLSLTQVCLLMLPVFWLMVVYTVFPPFMHLSWYKFPILLIVGIISLILALRVKDKIVLNWLVILLRYNIRPKFYVFDKNDPYMRAMDIPANKKNKKKYPAKSIKNEHEKTLSIDVSLGDIVILEGLMKNPRYSFSIKSQKKGALYVAIEQNKN